ncbi:hypothetical protein DL771_003888 [Monosporascus sp. 5C6A]|nr:hypothetical protein DL771_003888 [Monosporascus sp. 5C6A]
MAPDTPPPSPGDPALDLPRILCLHGGGTNARIFRAQCRVIRAHLISSFRLVFADAPFPSPPGPDVESVYGEWGPFRSWLPAPKKIDVGSIDACIAAACSTDDRAGATGRWVGLLGFSQGAGVAASLLLRQQKKNESQTEGDRKRCPDYRFAVLMAGRALSMPMDTGMDVAVDEPGLLQLPTIHVHGLRDPGIEMHRTLLHYCCRKSNTRLVEWDGDHRAPITTEDVAAVVAEIEDVAFKCGALGRVL